MAGMPAITGTARTGAFRCGAFRRSAVPVWLNGAARTGLIQDSLRIDLSTGTEPHRASFDFKGGGGYVPTVGHTVVIGHGTTANALFSGRILKSIREGARAADRRPTYRCEAVGHLFEMSMARITDGFRATSLGPRSIVAAVLGMTSPSLSALGFSVGSIDASLDAVESFDLSPVDDIAESFGALFERVGAVWSVKHDRAFVATRSLTPPAITTITNSTDTSRFTYVPHDGARQFTAVDVLGVGTQTLWAAGANFMDKVPVESASLMAQSFSFTSSGVPYVASAEDLLVGTSRLEGAIFLDGKNSFRAGPSFCVLPVSPFASSMIVGAANVSVAPLFDNLWYTINGTYVYINSTVGLASIAPNSPYGTAALWTYWIDDDGPGGNSYGFNSMAPIEGVWNLTLANLSSLTPQSTWMNEGTPIRTLASRTNTPGVNAASSLFGSTNYGVIRKTIDAGEAGPTQCGEIADEALGRGDPRSNYTIEFDTRQPVASVGELVFVQMTSLAESGVSSLGGGFMVQDITIDGFGDLADTKGPMRHVRAGFVRRPTLWNVLQGV